MVAQGAPAQSLARLLRVWLAMKLGELRDSVDFTAI